MKEHLYPLTLLMDQAYIGAVIFSSTGKEIDYVVQYTTSSMTFFFFYLEGIFHTGKVTAIWLMAQVSLLKLFKTSTHFLIS